MIDLIDQSEAYIPGQPTNYTFRCDRCDQSFKAATRAWAERHRCDPNALLAKAVAAAAPPVEAAPVPKVRKPRTRAVVAEAPVVEPAKPKRGPGRPRKAVVEA